MASVNVQVVAICTGGDHATTRITKDGQSKNIPMTVSDLRKTPTQDDLEAFARVALMLLNEGKTNAQFKSAAQTGFTVTV